MAVLPLILTNGTTADANDVMALFYEIYSNITNDNIALGADILWAKMEDLPENQILVGDGTNKAAPSASLPAGIVGLIDHNTLLNLAVGDVHTQYILVSGTRAFTGDQSMGGFALTNVLDPVNPQDASTMAYTDAQDAATLASANLYADGVAAAAESAAVVTANAYTDGEIATLIATGGALDNPPTGNTQINANGFAKASGGVVTNGASAITSSFSYNVSGFAAGIGVTSGVNCITVTFDRDFADTNYSVPTSITSSLGAGAGYILSAGVVAKTTGYCEIGVQRSDTAAYILNDFVLDFSVHGTLS